MTAKVWNPVGRWKVTTEGDVEGRSTTNLGTHEGHIADIARELADKAYYSLYFTPGEPDAGKTKTQTKPISVPVHLDIKSGTWDLDQSDRVAYFQKMMKGCRNVKVSKANYYACVTLEFGDKK